jgi:hypothetical protein
MIKNKEHFGIKYFDQVKDVLHNYFDDNIYICEFLMYIILKVFHTYEIIYN